MARYQMILKVTKKIAFIIILNIIVLLLFINKISKDIICTGYYQNENDLIVKLQSHNIILEKFMLKKHQKKGGRYRVKFITLQDLIKYNPTIMKDDELDICFDDYNVDICTKTYTKHLNRSYKDLILSLDKNGFNNLIPIIVDKNYALTDGYHRMQYLIKRHYANETKICILQLL